VATEVAVQKPSPPGPAPPPARKPAARKPLTPRDVDSVLEELFQEIRAEAVIFIQGARLIAHAGNVTRKRAQELAGLTHESLKAADKIALFLEETDDRCEQCSFAGSEYSIYSVSVTPETVLSVALSARTPVGIVRYNLRRSADALSGVWRG